MGRGAGAELCGKELGDFVGGEIVRVEDYVRQLLIDAFALGEQLFERPLCEHGAGLYAFAAEAVAKRPGLGTKVDAGGAGLAKQAPGLGPYGRASAQ